MILASRSPRRRALLAQVGLRCEPRPASVDEGWDGREPPACYCLRLARAKARAAARPGEVVVGADTAVVIDGLVLGQPRDRDAGLAMLARLSGRAHQVYSAVAVAAEGRCHARLSVSRVWMRRIDRREGAAYWATGEPADKAGGYAIQGYGARFVTRLEGSYSGVMGLPLAETVALLALAGVAVPGTP